MTSQDLFDRIRQTPLLLAYFSIPACNVCVVLRPKVERMAAEHAGVEFMYVDSSMYPDVAGQHVVFAAPTVIVFMEGREVARFSRSVSVGEIEAVLERVVGARE